MTGTGGGGLQRYAKVRTRVIEREKIFFARREGNFPPAARGGNAEWARAMHRGSYLVRGNKREVWGGGGAIVYGVDRLGSGARSWDMQAFPLLLLS